MPTQEEWYNFLILCIQFLKWVAMTIIILVGGHSEGLGKSDSKCRNDADLKQPLISWSNKVFHFVVHLSLRIGFLFCIIILYSVFENGWP